MAFEVIPIGIPTSADDWRRAMNVPANELPQLDQRQAQEVARLDIDVEQFTRMSVLMRRFSQEREAVQGKKFGEIVEGIIRPLGEGYSVQCVTRAGTPDGWKVDVRRPTGNVYEFWSTFEVVEALVDGTASHEDRQYYADQLKNEVALSAPKAAWG